MYNFAGVPSQLKAYFDHIARAGVTFQYTEKVRWVCSPARRCTCSPPAAGSTPARPLDTQTSYVRDFLRFIGITDVEFVYAEGLASARSTRKPASPRPWPRSRVSPA